MKKILLITNIPTPYRVPLFNVLSEELKRLGYHFKVIFSGKGYERRKFNIDENSFHFDYHILDGGKYSSGATAERTLFLYKGLGKQLRKESPDLIIVSGYSPATMRCFLNRIIKGTPYIIWSGSVPHERNQSRLRNIQRKLLIRSAAACVAYGSRAKHYLEEMGARPEKIEIGINTVDTAFFKEETKVLRTHQDRPKEFTFLYLGYLIPRKNAGRILEAAARLKQRRDGFRVLMVGDGISRAALEAQSRDLGIGEIVTFTGYKQKEELPVLLAQSDVFLFQTDFDIWGLVLNETMAAGITALVSPHAGAIEDLLLEGTTGMRCNFDNIDETTDKMEWMMSHPDQVRAMGSSAAALVTEKASLAVSASGFIKAIQKTIKPNES